MDLEWNCDVQGHIWEVGNPRCTMCDEEETVSEGEECLASQDADRQAEADAFAEDDWPS